MQRVQEEGPHTGQTPPPPYTLVDQQFPGNNNNNNTNNNNNNNNPNNNNPPNQQQYHSQNPYPATVISSDADFRLAQKLQDEEYARWVESNPQQEFRGGESSVGPQLSRAPMPPIPEHYQYNHNQSYQNSPTYTQQCPIIYASPNQPPLPYTQAPPFANNDASGGGGGGGGSGGCSHGQPYYGSLNQGYYSSQSHPFYSAPYHNYHQIAQQRPYRSAEEEEDNSSCLTGLYDQFFIFSVCVIVIFYILEYYYG